MVGLDPLPAVPPRVRRQPAAHRIGRSWLAPRPFDEGPAVALVLGIETSCDETSVALVEDGRRVLANVIHSQVDLHEKFGGVVPELAARDHLERLPALLDVALEKASVQPSDVDLLAVTRGPGLVGCLLVGVGVGEGLATAWGKPLTGVNHLWGHIYAAMLTRPDLEPPLLGLVVSGAHSDLVRMPEHGRFDVIGRTRDDAAGEAFDKAARMLGLGFPGGPALDRLARHGDPNRRPLPRPSLPGLEYSFSGLKTALLYRLRDLGDRATAEDRADLAAAFEESVVESLLEKLDEALDAHPVAEVVVAGGVAANTLLRRRAAEVVEGRARLTMPPLILCTDNAAMIAAAGSFGPIRGTDVEPSLGWD
ncbi:MAG TPA: tRNA (adenosine(37)-N6)-threonylcarbamoyltransferase complex transferase subunit TsaD [Candidatus Dormibacteraeota bacterium]|nr:tRNA (adenosine(37)-N6)-threonylcarbamoyltransferase complex transferase subunit TsaD [Candidatus Dormibacteraeota bacterium]